MTSQRLPHRNLQQDFVGLDGSSIKHHGEFTAPMVASDTAHLVDSVFQIADVNRCLYSVSKITRNGGKVVFEDDGAKVYRSGRLITTFQESGGLYIATMRLKCPKPGHEQGFVGQVHRA